MNPTDFLPAYAKAIYKTAALDFTLSSLPNDIILFSSRSFAIITAYNPRSQPLSPEENHSRHLQLKALLQGKSFEITASSGESPDGSWKEEGFLIFDISIEEALNIGLSFEQHAILFGQGNRVALGWCEDKRLEWFYPTILSKS